MTRLAALLVATLFGFGCTEHAKDNATFTKKTSGRIHGLVRLDGALPAPSFESVKEHEDICGHQVPLQRIALGNGNGVQDAFVYLDGIQDRGSFPKPSSVLVDQKRCQYEPHTYRIKMWHEGVIRKRNIESLQRYEYEDPYEMIQDVTVQAGADTVVNVELSLRPAT